MIIQEAVASTLAVLTGLGCVLVVLRRYELHILRKQTASAHSPLHTLGYFYGTFAIFFVPTILVAWAITGNEGIAWKVFGSASVPIMLIFQGLDSIMYTSKKRTWMGPWFHRIVGVLCLLFACFLITLYLRSILLHWG